MYDVVVVGKANVDYLVRGPRLPAPGESVNGDAFQEAAGGKGANQAVGAARLGAKVALVARVGRDARGDAVLAKLHDESVETRFVTRDPEQPTGVALCQVAASGEKQILSAAGANARLTCVVLCQLGVPLDAVEEAVRLGRNARCVVVLDPGPPARLPDSLVAQLDLIRPNTSEAEILTGIPVRDRGSAREAALDLLRRGAKIAAVQAGEHGDVLISREREVWLPRFDVNRVDATGAGDAFASALAVCLAEGRSLEDAGPFASAAAALATTVLGAQASLPRREAVLRLLRDRYSLKQ
ncbi:MAG: ribokinase [Deltaproteobacteria bacterium]|nr:MAG: ribokinase [Deltaproteobacteria bacterium]